VGLRAGLDGCGKSHPNWIRSKVDVTDGISIGFKFGVSLNVPQSIDGLYFRPVASVRVFPPQTLTFHEVC